jgi:hypothetical protein
MMMDDCFEDNVHNVHNMRILCITALQWGIHYAIGLINARIFQWKVAAFLQPNQLC